MINFKQYFLESTRDIIEEGGAYGHMANIHEDLSFTFEELKGLVSGLLSGKLEATVKEKTDGQALAVSMRDGRVIFARNKGHLKNGGANAMSLKEIIKTFSGRGDLTDAFTFAAKDMAKALLSLNRRKQDLRFNNGHRWLNFEIIWPETTNTIPYNLRVLKLHNYIEYDDDGNAVGSDFDDFAEELDKDLEEVNAKIQSKFTIGRMPRINLSQIEDFEEKSKQYVSQLDGLQQQFDLSDEDNIGKYYELMYIDFINSQAREYDYQPTPEVISQLINRWVYRTKPTPNINNIKKSVDNKQFAQWISQHDKFNHKEFIEQAKEPIKSLFIQIGVDVVRNLSQLLTASPKDAAKDMRLKLKQVEQEVRSTGDIGLIQKIDRELNYLNKAGGIDSVFPTEGLAFAMNRKGDKQPYVYKLTATFAPVNQILGSIKYSRSGEVKENIKKSHFRGVLGPL
jgi:hypothetical protein